MAHDGGQGNQAVWMVRLGEFFQRRVSQAAATMAPMLERPRSRFFLKCADKYSWRCGSTTKSSERCKMKISEAILAKPLEFLAYVKGKVMISEAVKEGHWVRCNNARDKIEVTLAEEPEEEKDREKGRRIAEEGIAQLQSAMSASLAAKATELEVVKPGISELPKLPELSETSCIDIGDWLHALECPMGDISNGSATWWREILASLDRFYDAYLKSSNLDKLSRRPEAYAGTLTKEDRWSRVDKWATSMLLASLPEPIRAEVLASRLTGALQVLGRVMVLYRPGSAAERQQVLRALEVRLLWGLLTQWMH
eukprot:s1507_g2.t2